MANPNREPELDRLRAEVVRLTKIVSEKSAQAYGDVRDRAAGAVEAATPAARRAAAVAKTEGCAVAQTAREHPAALGSIVFMAMIGGLVIGYLLGTTSLREPPPRRYW